MGFRSSSNHTPPELSITHLVMAILPAALLLPQSVLCACCRCTHQVPTACFSAGCCVHFNMATYGSQLHTRSSCPLSTSHRSQLGPHFWRMLQNQAPPTRYQPVLSAHNSSSMPWLLRMRSGSWGEPGTQLLWGPAG
jgi:hypothetical protein